MLFHLAIGLKLNALPSSSSGNCFPFLEAQIKYNCLPEALFFSHVRFQTTLYPSFISLWNSAWSLLYSAETWAFTYLCISSIWFTEESQKCLLNEPMIFKCTFPIPSVQSLLLIWGAPLKVTDNQTPMVVQGRAGDVILPHGVDFRASVRASSTFPSNLFSYVSPAQSSFSPASSDLYLSAWGWLCNCLQLSLGASSFSPILWPVSSSHLVIPRFTALSPKLKSSTWLCLGTPLRVLTGKLSSGNNSGQLHTGLTYFASHFSGIAVLACLLFSDLNGISLI